MHPSSYLFVCTASFLNVYIRTFICSRLLLVFGSFASLALFVYSHTRFIRLLILHATSIYMLGLHCFTSFFILHTWSLFSLFPFCLIRIYSPVHSAFRILFLHACYLLVLKPFIVCAWSYYSLFVLFRIYFLVQFDFRILFNMLTIHSF